MSDKQTQLDWLKQNGIMDYVDKHDDGNDSSLPDMVKGRVLHIDADFMAYQVAATTKSSNPKKALQRLRRDAEAYRLAAGAESYVLHLTPPTSDKGGRSDQAIQKAYQAKRKGKPKPELLAFIRNIMAHEMQGLMHETCEADDGMAMAQWAAINSGQEMLSVIMSADKDLRMVPGHHLDWDSLLLRHHKRFGKLFIHETDGGTKTLKGAGTKFFWAQMLMGDPVDNIQGLPRACSSVLKRHHIPHRGYDPKCGPMLTNAILDRFKDDHECFNMVRDLYRAYGNQYGFKHWDTGEDVSWQAVFLSEAQLLWMRRTHDHDDCITWMKEYAFNAPKRSSKAKAKASCPTP